MKRRRPSERVDPFFPDEVAGTALQLREKVGEKVASVDLTDLRTIRRGLLSLGLGDRSADGWSSLVAIADQASGSWPKWARDAARELNQKQTSESDGLGVRLLADSRLVLVGWPHDHIWSTDLRMKLLDLEDAPWADHYGKEVSQRKIATLLARYDVRSDSRRIGEKVMKGYRVKDFEDAFSRYLPPQSGTSGTSQLVLGETPDLEAEHLTDVPDSKSLISSTTTRDVPDVPDEMQDRREHDDLVSWEGAIANVLEATEESK
jgi:hypothetical protein